MPQGGRLQVRSRNSTDLKTGAPGLTLTVADTAPASRLKSSAPSLMAFYTTKGIGGTGLGLWISKDILARHHGVLRVRSSQHPVHHGTVFSLFIPIDNPASAALRAREVSEAASLEARSAEASRAASS